jgi:predicted O-methyltransferase YrrM
MVDDIVAKAEGDTEVIVVLDGYWPDPPLTDYKNQTIIHLGTIYENKGMRRCINAGMAIARGKYVMKSDGHCLFDQGFDVKLMADCDDDWVVIPRRYRLEPETWTVPPDPRPPIDYQFLTYPFIRTHDPACGLHGDDWRQRSYDRKDILIDDNMSSQGSLYFTTRKWWFKMIAPMDVPLYGHFIQESQEVCNNTWLGGGRVVVNKKTWYAHWHKGKAGKGYGFSNYIYACHQAWRDRGRKNCIDYWLNNKFPKKIHDFDWLVEKFWPVPTWPKNWKEKIQVDKKKESEPVVQNRSELAKIFGYLGLRRGAEIGAGFGYFSEILCKSIPDVKFYAIDNWNGSKNTSRERKEGASGEEMTKKRLAPYDATIIKKDSLEAARQFPDGSLDFVFIDASHDYESVKADINAWTKKVRRGGIVAGHDYYTFRSGNDSVVRAVNEYVKSNKYELEFTKRDKDNPVKDDRQPCWFFSKI